MLRVPAPIRVVAAHVLGEARHGDAEHTLTDFVDTIVGSFIVVCGYLMHIAGLGALKYLSDREAKAAAPRRWWRMTESWAAVSGVIISWFFIAIGEIVMHHRYIAVVIGPLSLAFMVGFAAYFLDEAVSPRICTSCSSSLPVPWPWTLAALRMVRVNHRRGRSLPLTLSLPLSTLDSPNVIYVFVAVIYIVLVATLAALSIFALFKMRKTVAQLGLKHESNKVYRTWLPFLYAAAAGMVQSFFYLFALLSSLPIPCGRRGASYPTPLQSSSSSPHCLAVCLCHSLASA